MVFDIDKLNALIDQASGALSCDANCQKDQQIATLRQQIQVAVDNQKNAPQRVNKAVQDYIVYSKGTPVFNSYQVDSFTEEAQEDIKKYTAQFEDIVAQTQINLDSYKSLLLNYTNLSTSYEQYYAENERLRQQLNKANSDTNTNQRKTFYEDENIKSLDYYYSIIRFFYIIVIVVYCYFFLSGSFSLFSFWLKLIVLIVMITYPFFSTRLLNGFIWLYLKIVSVLPSMPFKKREAFQTGTAMTRQSNTGYRKGKLSGQPTPT
jgi:hypothetical protein